MDPFPELLAPAGNLEKLKIAVLYGADAVYLAGPQFSLRAGTDNFSDIELKEGISFAHERGAKIYIALNAFLHDADLIPLPEYVRFLAECEVDAVIVSDLGVIQTVKQHSNIPVHLSTQASCLNQYSAQLWKNIGVTRIVVGRELSIDQASLIQKKVGIEVEMFVHGAMCMSYSGNCTISNYTLARDSNRGGCSQSCRFRYSIWDETDFRAKSDAPDHKDVSLMSSKDLNGLELLPQYIASQITSLKIEGRMKSNLYVATTVQAYANTLRILKDENPGAAFRDSKAALTQFDQELKKVSHRQYTTASLLQPADSESIYDDFDRKGSGRPPQRNSTYELAGTVIEVKEGASITVLVKNAFDNKQNLEILTFDGDYITLPTQAMRDIRQEPIETAKSNSLVTLPYIENIHPLNLARKLVSA